MDTIGLIQMSSNWLVSLGCSAANLFILLISVIILLSGGDKTPHSADSGRRHAYILTFLSLIVVYSALNSYFLATGALNNETYRLPFRFLTPLPLLAVLLFYKTLESYENPKIMNLFTLIQLAIIVLVPVLGFLPEQTVLFINLFLLLWNLAVLGYGFYHFSRYVHRTESGNILLLVIMVSLVLFTLSLVNDFSLSTIDFVIIPDYIQIAGLTCLGMFLAITLFRETAGKDKEKNNAGDVRLEELKTLAESVRTLYNFAVELSGNAENSAERLYSLVRNSINRTSDSINRIHSVDGQIKVNISDLKNSLNSFIADISPVLEDRLKTEKSSKSIDDIANTLEEIENKGKIVSSGVVNLTSIIDNAKKNTDKSHRIILEIRTDLDNIESFSQTIEKVSEEANTLAMNAAIESAGNLGAGGTGFKVVSDDLRGLSSKIKGQTEEIKNVLGSLKKDLEAGITSTDSVRSFFQEIELITENIFRLILDIVGHSNVISGTINETKSNIESLKQVSEHLENLFHDNRSLTEELNREIEITRNNFYHIAALIGKGKDVLDSLLERSQGMKENTGELFRLRDSIDQALRALQRSDKPADPA